MNRIDAVFKRLKQEQKTAFIGFLTAGDPDIPTCMECVKQLEQNGCEDVYKRQKQMFAALNIHLLHVLYQHYFHLY